MEDHLPGGAAGRQVNSGWAALRAAACSGPAGPNEACQGPAGPNEACSGPNEACQGPAGPNEACSGPAGPDRPAAPGPALPSPRWSAGAPWRQHPPCAARPRRIAHLHRSAAAPRAAAAGRAADAALWRCLRVCELHKERSAHAPRWRRRPRSGECAGRALRCLGEKKQQNTEGVGKENPKKGRATCSELVVEFWGREWFC